MRNEERLILLDADVISHFIKGGLFGILPCIFRYNKVILNIVADELRQNRKLKQYIDNVIKSRIFCEIEFPSDKELVLEYARLIKTFGKGESACMAYCKFRKHILASSNLKDILKYCEENRIVYLTTMDFLAEAFRTKQISENDCNEFIQKVKASGSKLPVDTIAEYLTRYKVRSV